MSMDGMEIYMYNSCVIATVGQNLMIERTKHYICKVVNNLEKFEKVKI